MVVVERSAKLLLRLGFPLLSLMVVLSLTVLERFTYRRRRREVAKFIDLRGAQASLAVSEDHLGVAFRERATAVKMVLVHTRCADPHRHDHEHNEADPSWLPIS